MKAAEVNFEDKPPRPIILSEISVQSVKEIIQVIEVAEGLTMDLPKNESSYDYEAHALRHFRLAKIFIAALDPEQRKEKAE